MKNSRRSFIQLSALSLASAATPAVAAPGFTLDLNHNQPALDIGIAGYTFVKFNLEQSIAMMKKLNIKNLSIKDFHLPINSNQETISAVKAQLAGANIKLYAVGVIYMKTQQAVDDAFAYAQRAGVDLIVGVPNYDLLDYTEQKVKETNVRIAIHNHGPEDALYPGPEQVWDRIKNRDNRMGLCLDIGHATRAGSDLVKAIKQYSSRLFDLHIKDVTAAEKDAKAMEIGRGVIDFCTVVKALKKINYQGICSIEFEKDMTNPLAGMAESLGYFKGVSSCA